MNNEISDKIAIGDSVRMGYGEYQRWTNCGHFIPGFDGLKVSYRRYLQAVNKMAPSEFQKSALVIGWAMGHLHPHAAQEDVLNTLVRWGLVEGQGNFGNLASYQSMPAAAMRYTEVKSNKITNDVLFRFKEFFPMVDGELGTPEPEHLIVPIPLCLHPETGIRLTDGRDITIKDLYSEFKRGEVNYTISCDESGNPVISKIVGCEPTRVTDEAIKLTFSNGESVISTLDHKFMIKDGTYRKAEELTVNDELMSIYISKSVDGRTYIESGSKIVLQSTLLDDYLSKNYGVDRGRGTTVIDKPGSRDSIRVTEVELIRYDEPIQFYDIEVDSEYHNFLTSSGVMTHNCLLYGSLGIGVGGAYCKIPAFTYESLMDAYNNDDSSLLKSAYGLEIMRDRSNLEGLWTRGVGKVVYKFNVDVNWKENSVVLSGNATPGKPELSELFQYESNGWITISDESTSEMRLVFKRVKGVRSLNINSLVAAVERASILDGMKANHIIMFSHSGSVVKMGIKGWMNSTLSLYRSTNERWKTWKLQQLDKLIQVYKYIPKVVPLLVEEKSTEDISNQLSIPIELVRVIESKPLRYLRKLDTDKEVSKLESSKDSIKAINVEELITSCKLLDDYRGKW